MIIGAAPGQPASTAFKVIIHINFKAEFHPASVASLYYWL